MAKNGNIQALNALGQSVWYDNVSRKILQNGELKRLIDSGVSGLTSNPTIFKQAIADSSDYDDDVRRLSGSAMNAEAICLQLMMEDVGQAADLLRPVYDATKGADGFASIEVSPLLARDAQSTIEEARRIWREMKRPNLMVKVPATKEGLPAVQQLLSEGINVNITLIFSPEVYREVMEAYLNALEERHAAGQSIANIASVASFFVSRVDAICEKKHAELVKAGKGREDDRASFEGKVGIANSKVAYQAFEEIFSSPRFSRLKAAGARVQRPLWASTGTKNPAFSPVLYVEELAGRDTVNTMPPQTVQALCERATIEPRLHSGAGAAGQLIQHLSSLGVDLSALLVQLQMEGVKSFIDSYQQLIDAIEAKRSI